MLQKGLSLVEVLIVTCILGILAAIAIPHFQNNFEKAKISSAKDTLRLMRSTIELYASKNGDVVPGYPNNDTSKNPGFTSFWAQVIRDGKYLSNLPENPFNDLKSINVIGNSVDMPAAATGTYGWIYKPSTKDFRIDWPGSDPDGVVYYDY